MELLEQLATNNAIDGELSLWVVEV